MTNEEAIEYNKNLREYMKITDKKSEYKFLEENYIALDMANKALEQQQKTGHWIAMGEGFTPYECSECEAVEFKKSKYCPKCGAKITESEELNVSKNKI